MREGDRLRPARPSRDDEKLGQLLGAIADLNDSLQQLHAGVKTTNAIRRVGAESRQIIGGNSGRLSNSVGRLAGWAIRETSGTAAATVHLRDGFDASGDLLATIRLGTAGSNVQWLLPGGVAFTAGLYVEVATGQIEGCIWLGTSL